MPAFGGKKQRGGAGEIARIDRSVARQQKINHLEMAEPGGMAKWSGAKPVTRVDRGAVIKQFGRQIDAVPINSRK
jgi:hypothetical protein